MLNKRRTAPMAPLDRSYRALLRVPSVAPLLAGMQIARIGQSMVGVALVLFTLAAYRSPALTGVVTFFSIFPGIVVSPIAGALLDRRGRTQLVVLDYLVALGALTVIGVLALAGALPVWLLITIAAIGSLTTPLSSTGLRSLFPIIIPSHLWERVNAVDSSGYVIATIVGPPAAAMLVAFFGGPVAFIVIGVVFGIAAVVIARTPEPSLRAVPKKHLAAEAWDGLVYTWRNRTLRGLGFSISALNLSNGALTILVPLLVLNRLHLGEAAVGFVIAIQGAAGVISAFIVGRRHSGGRERKMLVIPMAATGVAIAVLLLKSNLAALALVMGVTGLLNGPLDVALFTLRQRRTHRSWTGRAFAVSMSFNYLGAPIGSALAGIVASRSIEIAIAFAALASVLASALAQVMVPATDGVDGA